MELHVLQMSIKVVWAAVRPTMTENVKICRVQINLHATVTVSRLTPYIDDIIGDHQCGFRRNRSTIRGATAPKSQDRLNCLLPDDSTGDLVVSKALIPQP